nr:hypothetical protein [Tanacetum cinerariifolium]
MTIETHNWASSAHQEFHKIVREEIFPIVNQVDARVKNFEIQFFKEAAKFFGDFKSLAKEADASLAKHKILELEIERLLKAVANQDIISVMQNASVVDTSDFQTDLEQNENVELEFQVLNYAQENVHLKATYKNLFDSIYMTRVQTKTKIASLQNELQSNIYKNAKLRTQLLKKVSDQKDNTQDTITVASTTISAAEPQVHAAAITTASPVRVVVASMRKRKGVVIRDPEEGSTTIIPVDTMSKDKGKGIMVEESKPIKNKQQLRWMKSMQGSCMKSSTRTLNEMWPLNMEDLESLWSLVKERFSTSKPNNFSDDFLLTTLGAMFERPDEQAQFRRIKGLYMVKRYPLSRFTLDQMLNAVRLRVEEQSEMSLELLRFKRQQHQEGQLE